MIREGVLWFLRRGLEEAMLVQRGMVERRIERVREKEKSVLYKSTTATATSPRFDMPAGGGRGGDGMIPSHDAAAMSQDEVAAIEAELSPEQLQLFAEENDSMLRHYEDTLNKVQYVQRFTFLFRVAFPILDPDKLILQIDCFTNVSAGTPKNRSWKSLPCSKHLSAIWRRRRNSSGNWLPMRKTHRRI